MSLAGRKPWRFENAFSNYEDATLFTKAWLDSLAAVFFGKAKGLLMLVAPKEEPRTEDQVQLYA